MAEREFIPLSIAVLTISDTRTEETDKSGALLVGRLEQAGHRLAEKRIVIDDIYQIRAVVSQWVADEAVQVVATRMLNRLNFEVTTARDGLEAVDVFRSRSDEFAFVLLDMTMPHLDGPGAVRAMREIRPDLKAVFASGYDEADAVARLDANGASPFLQKPFQLSALTDTVRRTLGE